MIGRLRGTVVERTISHVVIDVGGVGYTVAVTPRTLGDLPALGEDAVLHTHLHVREDQLALYGFASADERDLFMLLLGVAGVGPKMALAICATFTPDELRSAVSTNDQAALTSVPGIGKRSAEKLMVELRPKMEVIGESTLVAGPLNEAREALESLGYTSEEIRGILASLDSDLPVEDLVKQALRQLGRRNA